MPTFVFRLIPPRPSFALDLTDAERALMDRHADHWQPLVDAGRMVAFGPVMDGSGSWGLGVVEGDGGGDPRLRGRRPRCRGGPAAA